MTSEQIAKVMVAALFDYSCECLDEEASPWNEMTDTEQTQNIDLVDFVRTSQNAPPSAVFEEWSKSKGTDLKFSDLPEPKKRLVYLTKAIIGALS